MTTKQQFQVICEIVARQAGLSVGRMMENRREEWRAWPRQVAMYFCSRLLIAKKERFETILGKPVRFTPDTAIEKHFHKSHGTLYNAIQRVKSYSKNYPNVAEQLEKIRMTIGERGISL